MNLNQLVEALKPYSAIIVTGPQRSGTTIGARILAHELNYRYVDEEEFRIHDPNRAYEIMKRGSVVLQAPALCHVADQFTIRLNYAVVMMRRPIAEITKSEQRIGWRTAYYGLNFAMEARKYQERFGVVGDDIAFLKYFCFDTYQKPILKERAFDLKHDDLKDHPLFVSERKDFTPRQWEGGTNGRGTSVSNGTERGDAERRAPLHAGDNA